MEIKIREFSTFTEDLQALRHWLIENDCLIVAMESTGIYWQPVFNILESYMEVILVNARHFKNVPGRKTDVSDSHWLAMLLRVGLLRASFVPPQQVRFWRDLVRTRRKYVQDLAKYKLKVQKLLESANVRLTSVISDLFGKTGRQNLKLLLEIAFLEERIKEKMAFHRELLDRLKEVPGVNEVAAQNILAELGLSRGVSRTRRLWLNGRGCVRATMKVLGNAIAGEIRSGNNL